MRARKAKRISARYSTRESAKMDILWATFQACVWSELNGWCIRVNEQLPWKDLTSGISGHNILTIHPSFLSQIIHGRVNTFVISVQPSSDKSSLRTPDKHTFRRSFPESCFHTGTPLCCLCSNYQAFSVFISTFSQTIRCGHNNTIVMSALKSSDKCSLHTTRQISFLTFSTTSCDFLRAL